MAEKFFQDRALMSKPWAIRASDPTTPTLLIKKAVDAPIEEATVKTMSSEYKGKEILYPTIRMIDGELQELTNKEAMDLAIKKGDYVEYDSIEEAEKASVGLSNYINKERKNWKELTKDPAGFMEKRNEEDKLYYENIPFGNVSDFISGLKGYPLKPDLEKGILYQPYESKMQMVGSDTRNKLMQSVTFMQLYRYFKPEIRED
jgi:hypothetical protein